METHRRANKPPPAGLLQALLACLILSLGGSDAAHAQGCRPESVYTAMVMRSAPDVQVAETLTGEAVTRFMEAWNKEPPESNERADLITALYSPSYPDIVFVIISNQGCVLTGQGWAQKDYQRLKRGSGRQS